MSTRKEACFFFSQKGKIVFDHTLSFCCTSILGDFCFVGVSMRDVYVRVRSHINIFLRCMFRQHGGGGGGGGYEIPLSVDTYILMSTHRHRAVEAWHGRTAVSVGYCIPYNCRCEIFICRRGGGWVEVDASSPTTTRKRTHTQTHKYAPHEAVLGSRVLCPYDTPLVQFPCPLPLRYEYTKYIRVYIQLVIHPSLP